MTGGRFCNIEIELKKKSSDVYSVGIFNLFYFILKQCGLIVQSADSNSVSTRAAKDKTQRHYSVSFSPRRDQNTVVLWSDLQFLLFLELVLHPRVLKTISGCEETIDSCSNN